MTVLNCAIYIHDEYMNALVETMIVSTTYRVIRFVQHPQAAMSDLYSLCIGQQPGMKGLWVGIGYYAIQRRELLSGPPVAECRKFELDNSLLPDGQRLVPLRCKIV